MTIFAITFAILSGVCGGWFNPEARAAGLGDYFEQVPHIDRSTLNNFWDADKYAASYFFHKKGFATVQFYFHKDLNPKSLDRYEAVVAILEKQSGWYNDENSTQNFPHIRIFMDEPQGLGKSVTKIYAERAPGKSILEGIVPNNLEPEIYAAKVMEIIIGISKEAKRPPGLKK